MNFLPGIERTWSTLNIKNMSSPSVYWGLSMSMPKDGSLPELRPISHLNKDVSQIPAKHCGSKVIIQAFVLPPLFFFKLGLEHGRAAKIDTRQHKTTRQAQIHMPRGLISVLVLVCLSQHVFLPSAQHVCFQHKILMPFELATKNPKRTSKPMTSNCLCTSIVSGLGTPANSAEVEGCEDLCFNSGVREHSQQTKWTWSS